MLSGELVKVAVTTDNNIVASAQLAASVEQKLGSALSRFEARITRVEVHLADESAGRSTGTDQRCTRPGPEHRSPPALAVGIRRREDPMP